MQPGLRCDGGVGVGIVCVCVWRWRGEIGGAFFKAISVMPLIQFGLTFLPCTQ